MIKVLDAQMALGNTTRSILERRAIRRAAKRFPFITSPMEPVKAVVGEDLHAKTAAEQFGVPVSEVTPEMRAVGKHLNYVKMYSTPFGKTSLS